MRGETTSNKIIETNCWDYVLFLSKHVHLGVSVGSEVTVQSVKSAEWVVSFQWSSSWWKWKSALGRVCPSFILSWIVICPPQIQGAILVSSLLQLVLGFSGLVGLVLRFIGPLAIAPTINLIGLSLFIEAGKKCGTHWGIAALWVFIRTLVWLSDLSLALSLMLQHLYFRLF